MNPITGVLTAIFAAAGLALAQTVSVLLGAALLLIAVLTALSLKMANTWESS